MENTIKNTIDEYQVMDYTEKVVQMIINRNITRSYWLMQGQGGYKKESQRELENLGFPVPQSEFREEATLESALIYCEAVESYNPDHLIEHQKGSDRIRFTTWLYWKLRDLDGRMWRLLSNGTKHLDNFVDVGKADPNRFEDEFIFRDSLSDEGKKVLALLETGKGFRIKKRSEYQKANCHMGMNTFWKTFLEDDEDFDISLREFRIAWNEIKKAWNEIETDTMVYTVLDRDTA